jgi:hypothetical protein
LFFQFFQPTPRNERTNILLFLPVIPFFHVPSSVFQIDVNMQALYNYMKYKKLKHGMMRPALPPGSGAGHCHGDEDDSKPDGHGVVEMQQAHLNHQPAAGHHHQRVSDRVNGNSKRPVFSLGDEEDGDLIVEMLPSLVGPSSSPRLRTPSSK